MEPKKRKETVRVIHTCTQEDILKRHEVLLERQGNVLLGNGKPENGLLFMFRSFLEDEKRTKNDIIIIKDSLKGVNENHNVLLSEITRVGKELGEFKATVGGVKEGKEAQSRELSIADELSRTKKRDKRYMFFSIFMLCITVIGLGFSIYFSFRGKNISQETKQEQQITNDILIKETSRGQHYVPPIFRVDSLNKK